MKRLLKNPWTIGIGTTLVGGILTTIIIDSFSKVSIWSTMKKVLNAIWTGLKALLIFDIKVWWIIVAVVALIAFRLIYVKYQGVQEQSERPPFLDYTDDVIKGFSWEWKWEKNYEDKYEIEMLQPVCSECKTPLLPAENRGFYSQLKCPRCNKKINYDFHIQDEVKTIIYDNARKGYYKK